MPDPEHKKMTAMHFYGWEKGLKTGQYYLRSRPARDAIKFTVNMEALLTAADHKDPNEILNALEKVKEGKKTPINLAEKRAGGVLTELEPIQKKQKIDEESDIDPFNCENCGS